jgi:leukotriene-A4 hydrolase
MPDPTSQSNYLQIASEHVDFHWVVDFQQKIISGFAVHDLIVKQNGVDEVV